MSQSRQGQVQATQRQPHGLPAEGTVDGTSLVELVGVGVGWGGGWQGQDLERPPGRGKERPRIWCQRPEQELTPAGSPLLREGPGR